MVKLSSATQVATLTVIEKVVSVTLTLEFPATVTEAEPFPISGNLSRDDKGTGVPSKPIEVYVDGSLEQTLTTDLNGDYSTQITLSGLPAYPASVELRIEFQGGGGFQPQMVTAMVRTRAYDMGFGIINRALEIVAQLRARFQ